MKRNLIDIFVFLLWRILHLGSAFGQWTPVGSMPAQDIVALGASGSVLYAAALANVVYKSLDSGNTWVAIPVSGNPAEIQSMAFIDNRILIGTVSSGIFQSVDDGLSWQNMIGDILPVSGFAQKGDKIYAGTLGNGVYVYEALANSWIPFNNLLPISVAGSVNRIASSSSYLFIASGGNGVFHTYNFAAGRWEEGYYYGSIAPGLEINDLFHREDTIVVVNGNSVIRTVDAGAGWADDRAGARNGMDRVIYGGSTHIFLVTNDLQGAWVQKRSKLAPAGSMWANEEEYIPSLYVYDMLEQGSKLFLATDKGLYQKNLILGLGAPVGRPADLRVFPNPSSGEILTVACGSMIESLLITNCIGQHIYSRRIQEYSCLLDRRLAPGLYYFSVYMSDGAVVSKQVRVR